MEVEVEVVLSVTSGGAWDDAVWERLTGGDPHPFGRPSFDLVWAERTHHVVAWADDAPLAHAGLLRSAVLQSFFGPDGRPGKGRFGEPRAIRGEPIDVAGVGGVLVAPTARARGLGALVVRRAVELAAEWQVEHALLFCREPVVDFYRRLGWRLHGGTVVVAQPDPARAVAPPGPNPVVDQHRLEPRRLPVGLRTMTHPVLATSPLRGDLELLGLPF